MPGACPRRVRCEAPFLRAPARGREAVRPSGGSAAHAPLDLEDLLLLRRADAIDLGDVAIGGLLEVVPEAALLVDTDLPILLELLQMVEPVAAKVPDLDSRRFP